MKLINTTFFSGITTLIKIISGFIANKVIALVIGPMGVGSLGQFSNFLTLVYNIGSGAINSGVVKYTAEYSEDSIATEKLFSTSLKITIGCSLCVGLPIIIFSKFISSLLFKTIDFSNPIKLLGFTLIFYSLNSLLISIINGRKKIKLYSVINTLTSLVGLILTVFLVYFYKTIGAIYSLVLSQSVVFFLSLFFVHRSKWLGKELFNIPFDKLIGYKLFRFGLMSVVTSILSPFSQIILREIISNRFGGNSAGYWQGTMRISDGYLLLITTSLSTYYLPQLSSIHSDNNMLRKEIFKGYIVILPFVIISSFIIYYFRIEIIHLLFSNKFDKVSDLIGWQFLGDFFKISSWILAFLMLAKAMTKAYIITEIIFSLSYIIFTYFFTEIWGLKGISIAFALNYFCYLITMIVLFRKLIFNYR